MKRTMMMMLRQTIISLSGRSQPHCEGGFAQSDAMGTPLPHLSVTLTLMMMMIVQNLLAGRCWYYPEYFGVLCLWQAVI